MSDVLRTHVTNDMWDNNRKVGLGGSRAGYSPVVVQQVGDAHQVVGEHGGAHQDLEMRAAFERAPLHAAAAEQHRDAALNAGAESLGLLERFTALQSVLLGRLVTSPLWDGDLGDASLFGVLYILGAEEAANVQYSEKAGVTQVDRKSTRLNSSH